MALAVPERGHVSNGTLHAATRSGQVDAARAAELANDPLLVQARHELAGGAPCRQNHLSLLQCGLLLYQPSVGVMSAAVLCCVTATLFVRPLSAARRHHCTRKTMQSEAQVPLLL